MRTRAGSGTGFPVTPRFLHAPASAFPPASFRMVPRLGEPSGQMVAAARGSGKGLSGCRGKQGGRELWLRGQASRSWVRESGPDKPRREINEQGPKHRRSRGRGKRKEVGRLSRREDQLPILRVPQVDFDSKSSRVWMVKSCPGFHPTKTLQSPFAASLLNWNSWPSWPGLREAAPLLSQEPPNFFQDCRLSLCSPRQPP